jgi:hypothetical protein
MFIEYAVTGAIALLWLWYGFGLVRPQDVLPLDKLNAGHVTLAAPLAYALGMLIDLAGKRLLRGIALISGSLRREKQRKAAGATAPPSWTLAELTEDTSKDSLRSAKTRIIANDEELAKQYELRRSRERVARGSFSNVILAGGTFAAIAWTERVVAAQVFVVAAALLITPAFYVWYRFACLSRKFRRDAIDLIEETRAEKAAAALAAQELLHTRPANDSAGVVPAVNPTAILEGAAANSDVPASTGA